MIFVVDCPTRIVEMLSTCGQFLKSRSAFRDEELS